MLSKNQVCETNMKIKYHEKSQSIAELNIYRIFMLISREYWSLLKLHLAADHCVLVSQVTKQFFLRKSANGKQH